MKLKREAGVSPERSRHCVGRVRIYWDATGRKL